MLKHFPALVLIALVADLPLALISRAAESIDNGLVSTLVTLLTIAMITPLAKATAIVAIDTWERGETGAVLGAIGALIRNLPVLLAASTLWCIGVFIGAGIVIVFESLSWCSDSASWVQSSSRTAHSRMQPVDRERS
jgi:hypothetical protein